MLNSIWSNNMTPKPDITIKDVVETAETIDSSAVITVPEPDLKFYVVV